MESVERRIWSVARNGGMVTENRCGFACKISVKSIIQMGLRAAREHIHDQDKIWSRYSNDKVDIAGGLARVIRTLSKSLPLPKSLKALSIGSSNEPQFRILESAFRGGLYLLDIEEAALAIVAERIERQN